MDEQRITSEIRPHRAEPSVAIGRRLRLSLTRGLETMRRLASSLDQATRQGLRDPVPETSETCAEAKMNVGDHWEHDYTTGETRMVSSAERAVREAIGLPGNPVSLPRPVVPLIGPPKRKFYLLDHTAPLMGHPIEKMMLSLGWEEVMNYKQADAVVFPGGADVHPKLYHEPMHPKTHVSERLDNQWCSIWGHIKSNEYLKIGICRGAQFLNVMNNGKLWQDIDGHVGDHECIYKAKNGESIIYDVTSTHHQMMRPAPGWAEVWCHARLTKFRDTGATRSEKVNPLDGPDPEVVWYPNTRSLCFQPHPEYHLKSCQRLFELCLNRALGPERIAV